MRSKTNWAARVNTFTVDVKAANVASSSSLLLDDDEDEEYSIVFSRSHVLTFSFWWFGVNPTLTGTRKDKLILSADVLR